MISILMSREVEVGPRVKSITEMSACMTEEILSKGSSTKTWMTSTQAHTTGAWKMAEGSADNKTGEKFDQRQSRGGRCSSKIWAHI